jgi:CRP-like cAMP-binding protein
MIESGSVRVVRQDEFGEQRELMRMGVGEIFGELSLITGLPRTASIMANEDCIILELTKEAFDKILNKYQNLRVKLAILFDQRLKESQKVGAELKKSSNQATTTK